MVGFSAVIRGRDRARILEIVLSGGGRCNDVVVVSSDRGRSGGRVTTGAGFVVTGY